MQHTTVDDIIDDVEFELMQGMLLHDETSQGILALRQYQNKLRSEALASGALVSRETLTRLFRVNDMLITLLQEMNEAIHKLQRDVRRIAQAESIAQHIPNHRTIETDALAGPILSTDRKTSEIQNVMRDEALHIDLQARLAHLPLVGRLIGPLQIFLHRPGLFYTRLLANRQTPINRTLGNWILDLHEQQMRHNAQIARLDARLAALEKLLDNTANAK